MRALDSMKCCRPVLATVANLERDLPATRDVMLYALTWMHPLSTRERRPHTTWERSGERLNLRGTGVNHFQSVNSRIVLKNSWYENPIYLFNGVTRESNPGPTRKTGVGTVISHIHVDKIFGTTTLKLHRIWSLSSKPSVAVSNKSSQSSVKYCRVIVQMIHVTDYPYQRLEKIDGGRNFEINISFIIVERYNGIVSYFKILLSWIYMQLYFKSLVNRSS